MGTVWLARDLLLDREVAVKELTVPFGATAAERELLRERMRREARAAAKLDHPDVVTVHDVVEEGASTYLVLQYLAARTLTEVVEQDGPLSPQQAALLGLVVLGALRAAHALGIVHRDVKPSNVLVAGRGQRGVLGRVLLTDFGIASVPGQDGLTATGLLVGSPGYMAPERARGGEAGPASDLWSLGATLFTAVEGRPPRRGPAPVPCTPATRRAARSRSDRPVPARRRCRSR
jgi:serine/threonine protein kinase